MKDIFYTVIGLALVFWLGIKLWDSGIIWIILIGLIIIATIHSRKQHKAKTHKLNTEEPPAKPEIKENISDEKDEALSVTRQSDDSVLLENNLIKIQNQNFLINTDIYDLLYFTDGPLQNINSSAEEPSAISFKLPLSISEKTIKLGYYPSYKQCTPGQRYSYLCWLCTDLSVVPDIGFAFILLDCLERHIVNNENVKRCVQLIIKMQKSVNNKSFTYYSTTSIAYAVIVLKRSDLLSEINLENCNPYFQVLLSNKLSPQDLVNFAKLVGFTNNRYIKNYKDYFIKALSEVLKKDYGTPYFTYKFTNLDKIARIPVLFSNIALNEPALLDGQVYSIPNLFSNIDFSAEIYKELQKAHSEVKNFLKIKRASDPNFSEAEKRKNQIKTKKRINPDTGYPMSTDKQIQYAKEEIDNVKSILIYHQTELKDPIYQKYNPLSTKLDKVIDKVQYESRIPFVEGMYFYKCGEWEKAENKWLSCLFTSFEPADRLRIMYQKEKRFKDAVSIIQLVLHSSFTRAIAPQSIEETEGKLEKAKQRARKNEKIDKSKLTSSKLNQLDNEATKLAKKYLN